MAHSKRADGPYVVLGVLLSTFLIPSSFAATMDIRTQGGSISADEGEYDLRSGTHALHGNVRVTQGDASMEAEEATVTSVDKQSHLTFKSSVHIRTADADLRSDSASAIIVNDAVSMARALGSPAEFERLDVRSDKTTRGRAEVIEYDVGKGIVKLTGGVWFSNGKDEFRSDALTYNLFDESVKTGPVRITIPPGSRSQGESPSDAVRAEDGA